MVLEDIKVSVKLKLATFWASFMFLYIYVDYFALYMPGKMEGVLQGKVFVFDITQGFLLVALASDHSGTDGFPFRHSAR